MKDVQKGNVVFECDECGETLETGTGDWEAALNVLRRNGWKPRKSGDEWEHVCDKCK